jgi:hypothetical protein
LDYNVPPVRPDEPKGPAFSMRRLYVSSKASDFPAPNLYYPKIIDTEKKASLKGMHKETKFDITPGPANYILPTHLSQGPQISLCARNYPTQGIHCLCR